LNNKEVLMRFFCGGLLAFLLLSACGGEATPAASDQSGDGPLTAQALAAIAADYTPEPDSQRDAADAKRWGKDTIVADLLFEGDGDANGNRLTVAVGTDLGRMFTTCEDFLDGCERVEGGMLFWQEEEPEEDPGLVAVVVTKGKTLVVVTQSSEKIVGDPRDQDLQITVHDMVDFANNDRVNLWS
jgi:hypothetical protein